MVGGTVVAVCDQRAQRVDAFCCINVRCARAAQQSIGTEEYLQGCA